MRILSFLPAFVWALFILRISSYPGYELTKMPGWHIDKIVHILIYFVLVVLSCFPFSNSFRSGNNRWRVGLPVLLVVTVYSGIIELLQEFVFISRSGNWLDLLANIVGGLLGILVFPLLLKKRPMDK